MKFQYQDLYQLITDSGKAHCYFSSLPKEVQRQLNQIPDQIKNMPSLCSYGEKLKNQHFQRPFYNLITSRNLSIFLQDFLPFFA